MENDALTPHNLVYETTKENLGVENSFLAGAINSSTTKIDISFENLNLTLKNKKGTKVILDNLSGKVQAAKFTALMGPSGSGKTSLLNALAGRTKKISGLKLTGSILINGNPINSWSDYRRMCGYVEQDDLLFHTLTVRETIQLAADLRLPHTMSAEEKKHRVDSVISELNLRKCQDTRIGSERLRGISGGERKRVSVALEILKGPAVLFLDECTTGLDSFQALRVATTIKDLALGGRTMISSVHQPRSVRMNAIFSLFDEVAILSEGKMLYYGPADKMTEYFDKLGFQIPENFNPADFALDLVSVDMRNEEIEAESKQRLLKLGESFLIRPDQVDVMHEQQKEFDDEGTTNNRMCCGICARYEAPYIRQFLLLSQRAFRQRLRDKITIIIPLCTTIFFSLLLGFLYFQTGQNFSQKAIQDKVGCFFFMALNQFMTGMFGVLSVFPQEKFIINRERSAKAYALSPYFFSKWLNDLPMLVFPTLFCTIAYFLAGFKLDAIAYFETLVMCLLAYGVASSLGLFFGAFANSLLAAQGMAMPVMLIFILFSGFYANNDIIPPALNWLQWISPVRWIFSGIIVIQFTGITFECPPQGVGCIPNGEAYLNRLGLNNDTFERSAGILIGMILFLQFLAYSALRIRKVKWIVPS